MNIGISTAKTVVTRTMGRFGLKVSAHLPEILTGLGIAGGIATVVTAATSTLELEANTAKGRELVKGHKLLRQTRDLEAYPQKTYAKDLVISYGHIVAGVIKTYAIPFALGMASCTAVLGAVGILKRRNAAITAAYNMLDASYRAYKKRVADEVGDEKEAEIAGHFRTPDEIDDVDREHMSTEELEKLEKQIEENNRAGKPSPYAVWFDRKNSNWDVNLETTMFFLKCVQNMMNDKLRMKGHVFANDVYRALGCEDTKPGAVTGWLYDSEQGDQFIDLGLDKIESFVDSAFGNQLREGFWVELNVDGVIFDKLGD